jgi:flagellin
MDLRAMTHFFAKYQWLVDAGSPSKNEGIGPLFREDDLMGLRIRTNVESLIAQRNLSSNQGELSGSMERLASGSRINKAADDAAGLAISENLRAKTRGLTQAKRNANDGISLIQVAEGSLNEMSNMMIRMRELTVQAASDTIGVQERGYLQKEFEQLVAEVDRVSQNTEFNGRKLLGTEMSEKGVTVQIGYNEGEDNILNLKFSDAGQLNTDQLGLKDATIASEDREAIAGNLSKIDLGLSAISNNRATLGAISSRLGTAISNLSSSTENMMAANSRIRDVDFADETSRMTQARILSQAGLSVLTQANARPEMALALLR